MDGQNFNNGQMNSNYQDNTSNIYQAPSQMPEEPKESNTLAIVALVLGILSIIFSCCGCLGIFAGIAGLICAIISMGQKKSGIGTGGLVCSIIGIVLSIILSVAYALLDLA